MGIRTTPCICGKNAEICMLPLHGVFIIKCSCGRRVGADTELGALFYWNELMMSGQQQR
ncbi:MAG: hypothetical protein OSJ43_06735 [Oscillospiraceae bacterium]|nr:hypothetical protein [Oscillospiraceae bacterium]